MLYKTVEEVVDPVEVIDKTNKIPKWLTGTLLRDGPGLFEFGEEVALHSFDGMAMLRRYHVEGGQSMNFSRKLIESDILKENRKQKRFTKYGVGTPTKGTPLDRIRGMFEPGADNMVVNSLKLFGHYYAATELPQVIEYDPITLETLGKVDVSSKIPGVKIMTPHPLYDSDGTMWNIAFAQGPDRHGKSDGLWRYVVFKVSPPKTDEERRDPWLNLEIVNELGSSRAMAISYLHSFFMTDDYLIFTEQPWILGSLPTVLYEHVWKGKSLGESMFWDENSILRFHVVRKSDGQILSTKYEADPQGFFHIFNAYEEDGHLILDAPFKSTPISYGVFTIDKLAADPDTVQEYMIKNGPAAGPAKRWVIPLSVPENFDPPKEFKQTKEGQTDPNSFQKLTSNEFSAKAWHVDNNTVYLQPEMLAPVEQYKYHRALEFVAINPKFFGKKYRYGYGLGFPTGYLVGSIQKIDVEKKRITATWEDPKCRATEPVFVPKPDGTREDDGVVVFACLGTDSKEPSTHLVVLEPENLQELGRFSVPYTSAVGFHGIWIN